MVKTDYCSRRFASLTRKDEFTGGVYGIEENNKRNFHLLIFCFWPVCHNFILIMSSCPICFELPQSPRKLCAVANCDSEVCYCCAVSLIQAGRRHCVICRTEYCTSMVDAFIIAADAAGAVVNVRDAFHETDAHVLDDGRNVRRRLFADDEGEGLAQSFVINGMLHFREVIRECTEILSYQFSVRWDTTTQERRFLIVNGFPNDGFGQRQTDFLVRTGFTTHTGEALLGQQYYCSSNPGHLPPIMFGPLFLNDRNLIPDQFRQAFDECKFFYLRDQLVRNYNPWYYGHRPWTGGENQATSHNGRLMNEEADTTNLYTTAIKVGRPMLPYISWCGDDRGIFLTLAFDWCLQAKVLPRLGLLQRYNGKFYDISPVHCSRLRIVPYLNYREFDCVCMLSIRTNDSDGAPWRSGMFLFLRYKKVNRTWEITEDSCAVSPNANTPRITISAPMNRSMAHSSLLSFCRRFL